MAAASAAHAQFAFLSSIIPLNVITMVELSKLGHGSEAYSEQYPLFLDSKQRLLEDDRI